MIGHAINGGKTFGLHQPHPYFSRDKARLLDYVIATSEAMVQLTAEQSGVDVSQVLPLGLPRTDKAFWTFVRAAARLQSLYKKSCKNAELR